MACRRWSPKQRISLLRRPIAGKRIFEKDIELTLRFCTG
jgi:hypothetical protein